MIDDQHIRILAWGIETSVLYPGFIAIATIPLGSWEVEGLRAHATDANEIRFVSSIPADLQSLKILGEDEFSPSGRPDLKRRWHRTSKARLFAALAHIYREEGGRAAILNFMGGPSRMDQRQHQHK